GVHRRAGGDCRDRRRERADDQWRLVRGRNGWTLMPKKPPTHTVARPAGARVHGGEGRASAARRGYGRVWQRLRRMQLRREPLCRAGRGGDKRAATEVDHIVALVDGGTNESDNLQSLCKGCHSRKTAAENRGFGRGGRGSKS